MDASAHLKKYFQSFLVLQREVNRLARARDPNRDKALEIYKAHEGNITNRAIAEMLSVPEKTISAWKSRDKWTHSVECSTTKPKRSTTKKQNAESGTRATKRSRSLTLLLKLEPIHLHFIDVEIYLDAYEEYQENKNEKLRKELAKYLGQLGLDGKNKELIKKSGTLLAKGDEEKQEEQEPAVENSKLVAFRQRRMRG